MDKVVIDDKTFVPYITNDKIQARIKEVAAEIKKDCESRTLPKSVSPHCCASLLLQK